MKPIFLTAVGNPENQDRGLVFQDGANLVLCMADGSGGMSGGAEAAGMAVELVRQNASRLHDGELCAALLRELDTAIAKDTVAGETTCALAVISPTGIFGASAGDSGIWLVPQEGPHVDLTRGQQRKPFPGSGSAWPVPFHHPMAAGWLLLATDGLLKYTPAERIIETCRRHPVEEAARRLIELVRYQSGALPDDVTVILTKL